MSSGSFERDRKTLGEYFRRLREGYGWTLRHVEARTREIGFEIDNSQVSKFEHGLEYPQFPSLNVLCKLYKRTLDDLHDVIHPIQEFSRDASEYEVAKSLVKKGRYWEAERFIRRKLHEDPEANKDLVVPLVSLLESRGETYLASVYSEHASLRNRHKRGIASY